jgi:hypothetical protein
MIEALAAEHPHLAPYDLFIPLHLLWNGLQYYLACGSPDTVRAEELGAGLKESGVSGRELGVAVRGDVDGPAGRHSATVHVLVVRAMSRPGICDYHDVGFVIYVHAPTVSCSSPACHDSFFKRASLGTSWTSECGCVITFWETTVIRFYFWRVALGRAVEKRHQRTIGRKVEETSSQQSARCPSFSPSQRCPFPSTWPPHAVQ